MPNTTPTSGAAYDELLHATTEAIAQAGSAGKRDIAALLFWKRLRADTPWVSALNTWTDKDVRVVTAGVYVHANAPGTNGEAARNARRVLREAGLPGFGGRGNALASALILACAPGRMAVWDERVERGLEVLAIEVQVRDGWYGSYIDTLGDLLATAPTTAGDWTLRDLDKALYMQGRRTAKAA